MKIQLQQEFNNHGPETTLYYKIDTTVGKKPEDN